MTSVHTSRRDFLKAASAMTASALLVEESQADESVSIVDTHQHLWDLSKFKLPWLETAKELDRSYVMADYLVATKDLGVVKSVYMEVDVEPSQQLAEANYVLDIIETGRSPMVGAVISGRPNDDGFKTYLDHFVGKKGIKGLRQVLHSPVTPKGYCLDSKFISGIKLLGERNLSFDICIRPEELNDAAALVDACPGTEFILDHCGNAKVPNKDRTDWKKGISTLAKRKNLSAKISGIVASSKPGEWTPEDLAPIVNHVLDEFGPDRVVFGGDWPVCTLAASYRQWVEALRLIIKDRPRVDQRKLLHDNALRVYKLA